MSGSRILFLVTGSVAAYKACDAVSRLIQSGHSVKVALSQSASRFVGAATFEGLTREPVLVDLFEPGRALDHTELTRWCDAVVVCPATANTINKMAAGIADDLVGAILLAHDWSKPLLIAPAMNPRMWSHPATVAALRRIHEWGVRIIDPEAGRTACGDVGEGRLADPARIVSAIEAACKRPETGKRVVVTSGGTAESLDSIRVLGNRSTGATGAAIARRLATLGHDVILLRAKTAQSCPEVKETMFESFDDLHRELSAVLEHGGVDAVVHAAAVGDFRVESVDAGAIPLTPGTGKLDSDSSPVIRLAPQPKLIEGIRSMSPTALTIVGFKLTSGASAAERSQAVSTLFSDSGADFVVHNDLAEMRGEDAFPATIHARHGEPIPCASRSALADAIGDLLAKAPAIQKESVPC